jgi:hypothetical protein
VGVEDDQLDASEAAPRQLSAFGTSRGKQK